MTTIAQLERLSSLPTSEILDLRRPEALIDSNAARTSLSAPPRLDLTATQAYSAHLAATSPSLIPLDQLKDAAFERLRRHHRFVDAAKSCVGGLLEGPARGTVGRLNALDWKAINAGSPAGVPVARDLYMNTPLGGVAEAARYDAFLCTSVGVCFSAQLGLGGEGGIGIVDTILKEPGAPVRGTAWLAGKLGIALDLSLTLAIGAYYVPLSQYAGGYVGLALGGEFFVGGMVAAFFSVSPFQFIGFSIAGGIGFTVAATAMGGYTWVF